MPTDKQQRMIDGSVEIAGQLDLFRRAALDGDSADWTAVDLMPLGGLVRALVAADGGLMFRASQQRTSVSVGVFLGGPGTWTTCRDQVELLAVLEAALKVFETVCGVQDSYLPAEGPIKPRRPRKRSS